jgi:hypothetical protein
MTYKILSENLKKKGKFMQFISYSEWKIDRVKAFKSFSNIVDEVFSYLIV